MPLRRLARFTLASLLVAGCSSTPQNQTGSSTSTSGTAGTAGTGGSGSTGGTGGTGGGALPCGASGVSKGPWSLAIDETHAKVRWESCRAGSMPDLIFAPEKGGSMTTMTSTETPFVVADTYTAALLPSATPDYAGTWYMHEAALTGLAPATCYGYHLAADPTLKGRFCTARMPGDAFTFMSIGDTNPGIGPYAAGDIMYALPHDPDFTLHGGDIQYYSSGLETWASWFPVMQPMLSQGGFFPAVGNHESEMPAEYADYDLRFFGGAGFDGTLDYYRFHSGGVYFFSLDTELPLDPGGEQGGWLVKELQDASMQPGFRFSIIEMHRPLVTCGDSGDDPGTRAKLEPIFLQYHVAVVLQAHMHGYERFEFGNITYLTIAGGGGRIGDVDGNITRSYCDKRVSSGPVRHAAIFDVSAGALKGTIVDYQGNVFDSFTEVVP